MYKTTLLLLALAAAGAAIGRPVVEPALGRALAAGVAVAATDEAIRTTTQSWVVAVGGSRVRLAHIDDLNGDFVTLSGIAEIDDGFPQSAEPAPRRAPHHWRSMAR